MLDLVPLKQLNKYTFTFHDFKQHQSKNKARPRRNRPTIGILQSADNLSIEGLRERTE